MVFGLWRVCFPPVLVRTGRRLPVQALGERGVLVSLTGYPRGGAPVTMMRIFFFMHRARTLRLRTRLEFRIV